MTGSQGPQTSGNCDVTKEAGGEEEPVDAETNEGSKVGERS